MIATCVTVLMLTACQNRVTWISVGVVAPHEVSNSLVRRICAEAAAIWGPAGVVFVCERDTSTGVTCPRGMEITIDDRHPPGGLEDALGWLTFMNGTPGRSIHLSRSAAERVLRSTPGVSDGTITLHETLIGRALGRALAHEFGHYVFRSQAHTLHGLMRATWSSDQAFAVARTEFELTIQQRAIAAECLRIESRVFQGHAPLTWTIKANRPAF
jgi:hypothetical protein